MLPAKHWLPLLTMVDDLAASVLTFLISAVVAFGSSVMLHLHGANPYSIANINNAGNYNPETNYLRVLYIIFATVGVYLALSWLRRKSKAAFRWLACGILAFVYIAAQVLPSIESATNRIDTFHGGEQLAPTLAYYNGQKLFTDIFFLHGAGEDVLVPALGFKLGGGPSISSYLLTEAVFHALAVVLFFLLIALLIRPTGLFLGTAVWFSSSIYNGLAYTKNIPVIIVIACWWMILRRRTGDKTRAGLLIATGVVSSLALFYSIDVGVILLVLAGITVVAMLFLCSPVGASADYRLGLPNKPTAWFGPAALLGGVLVGQGVIWLFVGSPQYGEFLRMTLLEIPKYQGLMFDFPLPGVTVTSLLFWLPVAVAAVTGLMLAGLVFDRIRESRSLSAQALLALLLFVAGLFDLRGGVGRPDVPHIAAAAPLLFLAGFYTLYLFLKSDLAVRSREFVYAWPALIFVSLLILPQITIDPIQLLAPANLTMSQIRDIAGVGRVADSVWLTDEVRQVTAYVKVNSAPSDKLYVMTPEPIYYYTTARENPSRFAISWFADPEPYTKELLAALKRNPPKLVIYKSDSPYEVADSIPTAERIPEVNQWITNKYPHQTVIGQTVILSR